MEFKLGKQEHKADERTLMLANFMTVPVVPQSYDFDKNRAAFPIRVWGNDQYGNCVMAGQANQLLRLERIETRKTLPLTDQQVINAYKTESQREFGNHARSPGDQYDNGLVMLEAVKHWRSYGWSLDWTPGIPRDNKNYKIALYGELDPLDYEQLKAACYLLRGIQFGFWLPAAAQEMTDEGKWDYQGETGPEWAPGSWGGHAVFGKAYSGNEFEVLTWGMKIRVTKGFIMKYCDEAWAVVDNIDPWVTTKYLDVKAMLQKLRDVGASMP